MVCIGYEMTNEEIEIVLKELGTLTAKTADAVAGLVEKAIPNVGPFGDRGFSERPLIIPNKLASLWVFMVFVFHLFCSPSQHFLR